MPKTNPKTQPKKSKMKTKNKAEPKPVSITSSKTYWITLTIIMVIFGSVYGYMKKVPADAIALLIATVLMVIGFAFYLKFKSSLQKNNSRAVFLFVGASVIGFLIWVALVLFWGAAGLWVQISGSIGDNFFAITSMIICLICGAFIGDEIGDNKEKISLFFENKFRK
jgi:cation transport ATPase